MDNVHGYTRRVHISRFFHSIGTRRGKGLIAIVSNRAKTSKRSISYNKCFSIGDSNKRLIDPNILAT